MKSIKSSLAVIDLAGVGIIALGALATYYLGLAPAQRAEAAERADRETLAASKSELDAASLQLSSANSSLAAVRSKVKESSTVLRPASELFAQIKSITKSAESHTLTVSEINPSALVSGKRFCRIPIHLSGVGTCSDFSAFLQDLHRSYADLQVVSFKLLGRADDKNRPHFEAQLNWYTSAGAAKPGAAAGNGKNDGGASGSGAAGNGTTAPVAPPPDSAPGNP